MSETDEWNAWELIGYSREEIEYWDSQASEFGVTAWDVAILESIGYAYGQVRTKEELACRAFGLVKETAVEPDKVTVEIREALRAAVAPANTAPKTRLPGATGRR